MFSTLHALLPRLPNKVRAWLSFFSFIDWSFPWAMMCTCKLKDNSFVFLCYFRKSFYPHADHQLHALSRILDFHLLVLALAMVWSLEVNGGTFVFRQNLLEDTAETCN
jgi:hypothetical protein